MNMISDHDDSAKNTDRCMPWWVPVRNSLIMSLVLALPACCLGYLFFPFLPQPACIGGYGAANAGDVRAVALLFSIGFFLALPVIALLGFLGGITIHLVLNSPGRERMIARASIGLGIIISLAFWLVITLLLNRYICDL